jgi:hypothetical protein
VWAPVHVVVRVGLVVGVGLLCLLKLSHGWARARDPAGEGELAVESLESAIALARFLPEITDALVFRRLARVCTCVVTTTFPGVAGFNG